MTGVCRCSPLAEALTLPKALEEVNTISRIYGGETSLSAQAMQLCCSRMASDPLLHSRPGGKVRPQNLVQVGKS